MRNRTSVTVVGIGVTSLVAIGSCTINPLTGKRELALIPESQEIEMGKQAAEEVGTTMGLYENAALSKYVDGLGHQLAAKSERPDLPWTFRVVDDPVVNAFALPGGPIHVTRGLLAYLTSEAQLVSVMGHEIGHVTAHHAVRQMSKQTLAQAGLAIGMAVSSTVRGLGQLGMGGLNVLFLSYGRDAEREADDLGFRYTVATGYEVRAMPGVFGVLKRVSESDGGDRLPDWLSTHPSPDERIERINAEIESQKPPQGKVETDPFLAMTDGLVYGLDPRHGFFDGEVFKHPEMKFQVQTPAGWKKQNLSQAVVAQSPDGKGGFQLTLAAKGTTPADSLQQFTTGNQAISNVEKVDLPLNGTGTAARFAAKTDDGEARGLVAFVSHQGKVIQMLGIGTPENFATLEPAIRAAQSSFGPLTDQAALTVQPAHIKLVTAPAAATFADFAKAYPAMTPDKLAILNQLETGSKITAGQKLKIVEGKVRKE
jgi:predicted Zn-dependent protease